MLKKLPIYPFLFIVYTVLLPFTSNLGQINPGFLFRPTLIGLGVTGIVFGIFWLFSKNLLRAGFLTFLFSFCLLFFGHLLNIFEEVLQIRIEYITSLYFLVVWLAIFLFFSNIQFWKVLKNPAKTTHILNLGMIFLTIASVGQILLYFGKNLISTFSEPQVVQSVENKPSSSDQYPDIYILIMDSYGRSDVIDELYGVDNSEFLTFLEEKGFYVASQSRSNYIQTNLSISSLLNYGYVIPENPPDTTSEFSDYIKKTIMDNKLFSFLQEKGYTTVALQSEYSITEIQNADIYFQSNIGFNDIERLMITNSVLNLELSIRTKLFYQGHRQRLFYNFDKLNTLPILPGPKVVFAHLLLPHPPFIFDQEGNPVKITRSYTIWDGDKFEGSDEEYLTGYKNQLLFTNTLLESTIQTIINQSSQQPIIILQGDHGPGAYLNWNSFEKSCLWERTGILNAYYVPNTIKQELYPSITPVNSFRIILNGIFNTNFSYLEDQTYFSSSANLSMPDITLFIEDKKSCPVSP